jgi:NADH-quinone oxidoreductase subunit E
MLSVEERRRIEAEAAKYPQRRAALSEALMIAQEARRWIDDATLAEVAEVLGVSAAAAESAATFYELVYRRPVGKHVIQVCDSVSCWLRGGEPVLERLKELLGAELGGSSADGEFTLLPAGCLGVCDFAPAMIVDGVVYGNLTPEKLEGIIEKIRGGQGGDPAQR